jgi:transcriptional regulator with XRE-family HTH domain
MKDDAKKLGENLKKLRIKKDISQIELARILGVDRSFVSNVENGKNNPTLSTLRKIASALGVSTSELLK